MSLTIGFSTGCLVPGNMRASLAMLTGHAVTAVELSALRAMELDDLLQTLPELELGRFSYVSLHAPSQFNGITERQVYDTLEPVRRRGWPIILHPDAIQEWDLWARAGPLACLENMDQRKPGGRTVRELSQAFARLPQACFCFDIGHAQQVDPSMKLAREMLVTFGNRLRQIHLSQVNQRGGHEHLNPEILRDFTKVADLLPSGTPIILETPVQDAELADQLHLARDFLNHSAQN